MSAPDFYFALNAIFRHIHVRFGMVGLIRYWQQLGGEHYAARVAAWREGGAGAVAGDWREYFAREPGAVVLVEQPDETSVTLDVRVCPAIKHLHDSGREIVPYFCDHCDHVCGAMGAAAGFAFERTGGMGSCRQKFTRLTIAARRAGGV